MIDEVRLRHTMDSPAKRLERIIIGIIIPLLFLVSVTFIQDDLVIKECSDGFCNNYIITMILILIIIINFSLLFILRYTRVLDKWFSKELEYEMRERLDKEYLEADVANLGSSWAKMEINHLESKHVEEE